MSTRPLPPPELIPDDPGPWSVVSHVRQTVGHRPDQRRKPTPFGLLIASPPRIALPVAGLDPASSVAGVAPLRLVAAAREAAMGLSIAGAEVVGVRPGVLRRWSLPDLAAGPEERPERDPAADLPPPVPLARLPEADLAAATRSPDGAVWAVSVTMGGLPALALVRVADRALVRWIVGARAGAWTPDGRAFVLGGDWGLLMGVPAPAG
jgi:hypothetical protein